MLDTNTVSHLLKKHPAVARRVVAVPITDLCISAITQGELLFGLARRPGAKTLHDAVHEFLRRVDVLPWDATTAAVYGPVRAATQREGRGIAPMDLLIGTHALSIEAVLVTNDRAFGQLPGLLVEDWTEAPG
jgi:tRNA(fMet)-specific endonuclease VapC